MKKLLGKPIAKMFIIILTSLITLATVTAQQASQTDEEKIADAMSAAPTFIAENATIMDWPSEEGGEMTVLREGTNGWVCFPSGPVALAQGGQDPWCLDEVWQAWLDAFMVGSTPEIQRVGLSYMLRGTPGESNIDPYATEPTPDNQWVRSGPHVMVLVPDPSYLEGIPTDPENGDPWVMWADTPYAHIMMLVTDELPTVLSEGETGGGD